MLSDLFTLQNFLILTIGGYLFRIISRAILDPLRDVPGPFLARFTRAWYALQIWKGDFEVANTELHRQYGAIVRLAPGEYSIDDVEGIRTIYGHGHGFIKAPWYSSWMAPDVSKVNLFADTNPHRHGLQRRKFASFYSMSALVGYEPFVNNCSNLLTQRFQEIAASGKTINFQHWLQCYAFDVIGEITFGKRFGLLDMGEDKEGIFKAIDDRGVYSTFVGIWPWLHQYIFPLLPKNGGYAYMLGYTTRRIEEKQKVMKDPSMAGREGTPDIMTKILQVHEKDPEKMTRMDLMVTCQSNIGAGSDTTAITLSSVFYHLMKHPKTYQRLREEIDLAAKESRISDPITFKESQDLPYLQAVIKEALRIHPATGLPMPRIVPKEGVHIAGRFIPGGTTVGVNSWVAHRIQSVFGSDAEMWRPERWLEIAEQGRGAEVEKSFLAFGMGSRTCIGKNISLLEVSKLVPQLVRRFEFVLDERCANEGLKSSNRWFVKQTNFEGKILARNEK